MISAIWIFLCLQRFCLYDSHTENQKENTAALTEPRHGIDRNTDFCYTY